MNSYFDKIIDRTETSGVYSSKWQGFEKFSPDYNVKDVLPMWIADMDFPCPEKVIEAVNTRASHGIYGYSSAQAVSAYKRAAVQWLKRLHGYETTEEQMLFTPGVLISMNACIQAFTKPGDGIIIQPPVYYPFANGIKNNDRKIRSNSLVEKNGYYEMNFEQLESFAKEARTKLLILSNPHNPVGRAWKKDELLCMAEICRDNGVLVFSDEIHCDLIMKNYHHVPTGTLGEQYRSTFINAYSTSKTFNIAGLGASLTVIPDETNRKIALKQMQANGVAFGNVFGPIAGEAAYKYGEQYAKDVVEYIEANMDYAKEFLKKNLPRIRFRKPEATYLPWFDFREIGANDEEIKSLILEKAKIAVDLGTWFGPEGSGFARFNFACPRTTVVEAMQRLKKAFAKS